MKLIAYLVDDEPLALDRLNRLLEKTGHVEIAGSTTDPPALAFAGALMKSDAPSLSYATVYPLTMILRILTAQLLAILFGN